MRPDLCFRRVFDELFDDQRFKCTADTINILGVLGCHGDHGKTAIVEIGKNAFGLQLAQRFPQRCAADIELLAQVLFHKPGSWLEHILSQSPAGATS